MNPYCMVDLRGFTVEVDGERVDFSSLIGDACPSLMYTAIPYVLAMDRGVRFPWEKQPDSVLVNCPAGHVAIKLLRKKRGSFMATIVRSDGGCSMHAEGGTIRIRAQRGPMQFFNRVFPYLFRILKGEVAVLHGKISIATSPTADIRPTRQVHACDLQSALVCGDENVQVAAMKRPCAYHRRAGKYPPRRIAPPGLCWPAYHAAYPEFLAMLYGSGLPDSVRLSCPGSTSRVVFTLERKPRLMKPFLDLLERALSFTPVRLDLIKYRVTLRVASAEGVCPEHLRPGQAFVLGNKEQLCPSSFYSLFPSLLALTGRPGRALWRCACTSVPCHIIYELVRKKEK